MPKKNKNTKANLLYNKISKEFTKINSKLPEEYKQSVQDRRKFIKERIIPIYKNSPLSRIGVKSIRASILEIVQTIQPKIGCDVNYISSSVLDINFYDLDDFIKDVLPSCIFIKINAGVYGSTKIFNTRNYNYTKNLVKNIVDSIRDVVNNNSDTDMTFTGVKKLKPRKLNDGTPENYFIDFILTINSEAILPIDPIIFNLPKSQQKQVTKIKDIILGRVKQLSLKKKRKRNARKTATKNISKLSNINRRQAKSNNQNTKNNLMAQKEKLFQNMIRQLENAFKKGLLSNEQFDKFKADILVKVLTNREKGGII